MYKPALLMLALSACVVDDEVDNDVGDETYGEADQGISTNNGVSLNGVSLNGVSLNGVSLNGVSLNGTSLSGVAVSGSSTTAPPLSGSAIVGSTWTATTTSTTTTTVKLRIDNALQGTGTNADLWFYGISYQTSTGWSPVCGLDTAGVPIKAVSTAGQWIVVGKDKASYTTTTSSFTIACRGKTIAKCVELGYKTYKGYGTQLATCVRALRGDYCGNGTAYTLDGTLLNLYDKVGVQLDTEAWTPEAEWTATGARCINTNKSQRFDLVLQKDPGCIRTKTATCGTTFANGAVLIDELSPTAVLSIQTAQAN